MPDGERASKKPAIEVFCSYAHEDEHWRQQLDQHLSLLKRQELIDTWYDRQIVPGTEWAREIDTHLERASVILLLISAAFFDSKYCTGIEMKRALERHAAGEARVIPILVRAVDWSGAPFAQLQVLPPDAVPIDSWPKPDEALAAVTAGIRRAIEDLSLLANSVPRAALPQLWNIPYAPNSFFIGRDELLALLHERLQTGEPAALTQPQAISGLGGIGKTQTAVAYAYRCHQDYDAVLWAFAESRETLTASYTALARLLDLPEQHEQEQSRIVHAVTRWLQTHRRWLLILDNADEPALLPDFLPPVLGGHLLLTTRARALGGLAQCIELTTFSPQQGALFLLRRSGRLAPQAPLAQASSDECAQALAISQELGGLPLALDQAGAYLEETGTGLAGYLPIFQQRRAELLRQRRSLLKDHPDPVATTWSLAFERVAAKNPAAADLLRLCAWLAPDAIPEELITEGAAHLGPLLAPVAADAHLLNGAIEALRAWSLLERDPQARTLTVHRLVQAVQQDAMPTRNKKQWITRAIQAVAAAFPWPDEHSTWPQCERLLPHAQTCLAHRTQYPLHRSDTPDLLLSMGVYLVARGHYAEAEPLLEQSVTLQEQHLGPEHLTTGLHQHWLASLYNNQGRYEQAEPLYQRALAIHEQQRGPQHPDTATSLGNLAGLYHDQGRSKEAEPLYQRALAIREQQLGAEHPHTQIARANYAALLRAMEEEGDASNGVNPKDRFMHTLDD